MGLCDATHSEAASPVSSPGTDGPEAMAAADLVEESDYVKTSINLDDVQVSLNEVVEDTLVSMCERHRDLSKSTIANSKYKLEKLQGLLAAVGENFHHQTEESAKLNDAIEYNTRRREEAEIIHAEKLAAMHEAIAAEANALKELTCILELLAELEKRLKDADFKEKSLAEQMSQLKKSMEVEKAACQKLLTGHNQGLKYQKDKYLEGLHRAAETATPPRFTTMHLVMCTGVGAVAAIGLDRFFKP